MSEQSCLVIAGEKSGEDHAMTFLPELMKKTPKCSYFGVGGSKLESEGLELMYHLKDFSGIGISEVLGKIPFYYKALDIIVSEVKKRGTKSAILIDFQGFNLKLAKELKKIGVNVLYYVAPQAWVWKPWRAKTLEQNVHTLFTILPFEKKWFKDRGVSKVKAVVHPLMIEYQKEIASLKRKESSNFEGRKPRVLLLPGSRNIEVSSLLPVFKRAVDLLGEDIDFDLGIVKTESVRKEHYDVDLTYECEWDSNSLSEALSWADVSIAASGTVTLATGLFSVPTVVCYKMSYFTEFVLNLLVPYDGPISLTNIIKEKMVFPELVQYRADRYNISKYLKKWLSDKVHYDTITSDLSSLSTQLTGDDFDVPTYMAEVINGKN